MEAYLQHLVSQSMAFTLMVVAIVVFLESLALVGLLLPGTVMMTSVGALIGSGQVNLYYAWLAATAGCFFGDWLSYFLGRCFREPLSNWRLLYRYQSLLHRTRYALQQHSVASVIIGRFVGPARPLVPLVAGMLELPALRFALPNAIACLTWPPVYFLPGILAGVAIDIPADVHSGVFKLVLVMVALSLWFTLWLGWRWFRFGKRSGDKPVFWSLPRLRMACLCSLVVWVISVLLLAQQPLMPVYRHLLWRVVLGHSL
jgi:membrane protein DedA with SNARE-associated domain